MDCPHDGAKLVSQRYEDDIEIDRCPLCRGVWLDKGELERIEEIVGERAQEGEVNPAAAAVKMVQDRNRPLLLCPSCKGETERYEHGFASQVLVDACVHGCGLWLDAGELEGLEGFYERKRLGIGHPIRAWWASLRRMVR